MAKDEPPRGAAGSLPARAELPSSGEPGSPAAPDRAAPAAESPPPGKQDVLFVHSSVEAGEGYRVIRRREDRIEVGELRPVEDGRPLHGDLVKLTPREDHARLFDVEVLLEGPRRAGHAGPAQVATDAYRSNWEAIFGPGQASKASKASN